MCDQGIAEKEGTTLSKTFSPNWFLDQSLFFSTLSPVFCQTARQAKTSLSVQTSPSPKRTWASLMAK